MPHLEDQLLAPDGIRLHQQCWLPDGESRAVQRQGRERHPALQEIDRFADVPCAISGLRPLEEVERLFAIGIGLLRRLRVRRFLRARKARNESSTASLSIWPGGSTFSSCTKT